MRYAEIAAGQPIDTQVSWQVLIRQLMGLPCACRKLAAAGWKVRCAACGADTLSEAS